MSCGVGDKSRTRIGDDPLPRPSGANCTSNPKLLEQLNNGNIEQVEVQACNEYPCPSK